MFLWNNQIHIQPASLYKQIQLSLYKQIHLLQKGTKTTTKLHLKYKKVDLIEHLLYLLCFIVNS